jgi:hypothetical protein
MGFAKEARRADVPIRREAAMTECEYPKKDSRIWWIRKKRKSGKRKKRKHGGKQGKKKKSSRELPGFFTFFRIIFLVRLVIPPVWSRSGARFLWGTYGAAVVL